MSEPDGISPRDELEPTTVDPTSGDQDVGYLPDSFGRYTVTGQLGRGSFGVVYSGWDAELERKVAIKVAFAPNARADLFITEARTIAMLDHPNIVPVFDTGRLDDGRCFIISKLIQGNSLAEYLERKTFTHNAAVKLVAELAEAAQFAHENGIVHRDIKPANVLIDERSRAYLCDFGLALRATDYGTGPLVAGSPLWMSPEQARGEADRVDGRADVFALGGLLYFILSGGTPPFSGSSVEEILTKIASRDVQPLRQRNGAVPKDLERICLKAMAREISMRHQCAQDLADDLNAYLTKNATLKVDRRFKSLEKKNELLALDQEWLTAKQKLTNRGRAPGLLPVFASLLGGAWIGLWGGMAAYLGAWWFGGPILVLAIGVPAYHIRRYSRYRSALARYEQRRGEIEQR